MLFAEVSLLDHLLENTSLVGILYVVKISVYEIFNVHKKMRFVQHRIITFPQCLRLYKQWNPSQTQSCARCAVIQDRTYRSP